MKKIFGIAAGTAAALALLAAAPKAANAAAESAETTTTVTTTAPAASTTTTASSAATTTSAAKTSSLSSTQTTTTTAVSTTVTTTQPAVTTVADGWIKDDSGRFFYGENGAYLTGEQTIDGDTYLFSANGVLKTGWRTVGGRRLYFDPATGKPVYGWIEYCGRKYFIAMDSGKKSGIVWIHSDEEKGYFFDEKGALSTETGFFKYGDSFYYAGEDGSLAKGETLIGDLHYKFADDFKQLTGWADLESGTYYYDPETGEAKVGFVTLKDSEGAEHTYYISAESGLQKGEFTVDGAQFSSDPESGEFLAGWVTADGKKYYYNSSGVKAKGITVIDDVAYIFGEDGVMGIGFVKYGDATYYANEEGKLLKGRLLIDSSKYYFDDNYVMATGFQVIGDSTYYFADDGKMMTGRLLIDGKKYYFADNGAMQTGLQTIDGKTYYFASDGTMQFGIVTIEDGSTYYFNASGVMTTGWVTVDGKNYHFAADGRMDKNKTVDGRNVGVAGYEVALTSVQVQANNILASTGKGVAEIFNYVRDHNKYKYIEDTKSLATIESLGWSSFAQYALNNRYVVCYYFAAITDLLFQQAGYQTRIIYGTGRGDGDHYWNQVVINGQWVNYDTCNGYYGVSDDYLKSQNYTWYKCVYAKYF